MSSSIEKTTEKIFEHISNIGEKFGMHLKFSTTTTMKIVIAVISVITFGTAIFIWSITRGFRKK